MSCNYFSIESVAHSDETYDKVEWKSDNNYQEVIMTEHEEIVECLFSSNPQIPEDFKKFLNNE